MVNRLARLAGALLSIVGTVVAQTDFSVTNKDNYNWNQTEWSLATTNFNPGQFQSRISLANGYVGASLAAAGPFFEVDVNQTLGVNGWPLFDERLSFSTISGFWDVQPNGTGTNYPWLNQYGWESFISGIPHSTSILFGFGDNHLDATVDSTTISDFVSKMSFKTGVAAWSYTWTPSNCAAAFKVAYEAFISRERPNVIAVKASITPSADIDGTVTDLIDGRSALRTYLNSKGLDSHGSTIFSSVHPDGLNNKVACVVSGADFTNAYTDAESRIAASGSFVSTADSTIGQTWNITLKENEEATFYKFVGVASNDKFDDAVSTARDAQSTAQQDGWDALLAEHAAAWAKIMPVESVNDFTDPVTGEMPEDDNVKILHIASVANTFYLLSQLQPDGSGLNDNSVSVSGLVADSYGGLVFWDADYWMSPSMNLAFPNFAKQFSNYRIKQYPQAVANAEYNNYPNDSALYSWTAGRYGNCTGTGPCVDYQYHLNYDISFNLLQQRNVTQDEDWFNNGPRQIIDSVAVGASHLLQYNETTKTYWVHNMTDPDEYANNIDNGAFTLGSAGKLLKVANALRAEQGLPINTTWEQQWQNVAYPKAASNITLEFQGMNNSAPVKQADIVLLTYPLDYNENYSSSDKLLDLDYYANKQSPDGPAMTYSIFAINANALSESGCSAYTYTLNGFLPYLRGPWFQFSEQQVDDPSLNGETKPAFPFITGAGGAEQVVLFGLLGIRTDQPVLYMNPSLPPQILYLKAQKFYYAGATLMASMNSTHTLLTRHATPSTMGFTDKYSNVSFPLTIGTPNSPSSSDLHFNIAVNETVAIPNRMYWHTTTTDGNLLQCRPVSSSDAYAPGQFPLAALDGATATRWQPASNATASMVVDMTGIPAQALASISFDWGARPPVNVTVFLGNSTSGMGTSGEEEIVIEVDGVAPDLPYDAVKVAESSMSVVSVEGNTTTVVVEGGAWTGDYVRLEIEGCWEKDGAGATVGEFVLIGA